MVCRESLKKTLDLTRETTHNLEQVAQTRLQRFSDAGQTRRGVLRADVQGDAEARHSLFLYVGGNDSSDTVQIVNRCAEEEGYEFRAIHPKTIDNDLLLNDHCPGFGSALASSPRHSSA